MLRYHAKFALFLNLAASVSEKLLRDITALQVTKYIYIFFAFFVFFALKGQPPRNAMVCFLAGQIFEDQGGLLQNEGRFVTHPHCRFVVFNNHFLEKSWN